MPKRMETDSMGEVLVDDGCLWGAQTQRAIGHFSIGETRMPLAVVHALAMIKKAAARVHKSMGFMAKNKATWIEQAATEVMEGKLDQHFPLRVWISGSGTQCNMNVNEVIANRAIELAGGDKGSKHPVHPNDDVNRSQSTNDAFPTAMHIATAIALHEKLLPALTFLRDAFQEKAHAWKDMVKIGRTHMQDAVPMTLGQEFSAYGYALDQAKKRIQHSLMDVYALTIGGTAVGTGINAPKGFDAMMVHELASITGLPWTVVDNKFAAQGAHDALAAMMGQVQALAASLLKTANDIRLLGCGPRAGLHELLLPENEPGSSIMPGKVNPTQSEALSMVCMQVMGMGSVVAHANAGGFLQMNAFKPVIIYNIMESVELLSDACMHFANDCIKHTTANEKRLSQYADSSLMLVTALNTHIGYDKAAHLAKYAYEHNTSLKEANQSLRYMSDEDLDRALDPKRMIPGLLDKEG